MTAAMEAVLKEYLQTQLLDDSDAAEIGVQDDLLTSGLDSIGLMGLIMFIEETFSLNVPPEDVTIESFGTIARIADYLRGRRGRGETGA